MEQITTDTIEVIAVMILIPLLLFIIYERQKRKSLERYTNELNGQVKYIKRYLRNLENDFVLLETQVENLGEEVRELEQKQLNPES